MELDRRLRTQWTESAQDWIETDQAIRTGMLDTWVLRALGDVSGKTVIDIGCGEGRFCRLLAKLGATVTGIDITEALIERARDLGGAGETYMVGDAEDLAGVEDDSFDLAVSYIVLVDLLDYRRSIGEAYRVLKPGGRFIVCNVHPMRSADTDGWVSPNPPMRSGLGVGTRGEGRGTRRSALDSDKWGRWRPLVVVGGADGGPGQRRWGGVGGTACRGRQSRTGPVRLCGSVG